MKVARIENFNNYYITTSGDVYNQNYHRTKKIKKIVSAKSANGYLHVALYKNGKRTEKWIHRLVAEAFIPNQSDKREVNYIDGNPTNNNVSNLEWVTRKENAIHAAHVIKTIKSPRYYKGKFGKEHNRSKIVLQIKDGKVVAEFYGTMEANRKTGINYRDISRVCLKKRKTAGGYQWKYVN